MSTTVMLREAAVTPCDLCGTLGGLVQAGRARPSRYDLGTFGIDGFACAACRSKILRSRSRVDPTPEEIALACALVRADWDAERWSLEGYVPDTRRWRDRGGWMPRECKSPRFGPRARKEGGGS